MYPCCLIMPQALNNSIANPEPAGNNHSEGHYKMNIDLGSCPFFHIAHNYCKYNNRESDACWQLFKEKDNEQGVSKRSSLALKFLNPYWHDRKEGFLEKSRCLARLLRDEFSLMEVPAIFPQLCVSKCVCVNAEINDL